jgi:alkylation response protein AidB-like acyl-CoA dehydrogenase
MTLAREVGFLGNHFEQAMLELAIAQDALLDAAEFVRTQAPAPRGVGINHAADDPHVILRFGQLRARLHAAEGLLARATRLAGANGLPVPTAAAPSAPTAAVLVALIEAHAFASDLVAEIASQLVAWGGPLRAGQQRRDASGQLARQTGNHWNYHYAGNYYLKGVVPPTPEPQP